MRKPCCDKKDINKGAWSKQEDEKLIDYIRRNGEGHWRSLPKAAGLLRCGKSCRLRWINYLRPDLKRGNFGEDEEDLIMKLHSLLGNRWSLIAGRLPGRTDNEVKNYWNYHLRRKLINKGVTTDANNHRLIQNVSCPSNPDLSDSATSSKIHACQPMRSRSENDHISDAARCLEDDNRSGLMPDLNLDLTITIPSNSNICVDEEVKKDKECTTIITGEILLESDPSPTLNLFR